MPRNWINEEKLNLTWDIPNYRNFRIEASEAAFSQLSKSLKDKDYDNQLGWSVYGISFVNQGWKALKSTEKWASFDIDKLTEAEAVSILRDCSFDYQPIISLNEHSTENKSEMLIRYKGAKYWASVLRPDVILDIVSKFGFEWILSEKLFLEAMTSVKEWRKVSLNLFESDFKNGYMWIMELSRKMAESNIDPKFITIELLENIQTINPEIIKWLSAVNQMWFNLFMDDFFSWYNTKERLQFLIENWVRIDWIKLDKEFFADRIKRAYWEVCIDKNDELYFENSEKSRWEIDTIISDFKEVYDICLQNWIKIIVEWVEWNLDNLSKAGKFDNVVQFQYFLAEIKSKYNLEEDDFLIDSIQGYLFSKPVEAKIINKDLSLMWYSKSIVSFKDWIRDLSKKKALKKVA